MLAAEIHATELLQTGFVIPPRPAILSKLQDLLHDSDPSISAVGDLISTDVGLSAAILKTINSPLYGMQKPISDVRQSVMLLGFSVINAIVMGILLRRGFNKESSISMDLFWDTASEVALAMKHIGAGIDHVKSRVPLEDLYSIGLFHDCGIAAFATRFTNYEEVLIESASRRVILTQIEEREFNSNHSVIGYYIAKSWGLPNMVCSVIRQHHDIEYLNSKHGSTNQLAFAVLHIAVNAIHQMRSYSNTVEWDIIKPNVFDILGIQGSDYKEFEDDIAHLLNLQ